MRNGWPKVIQVRGGQWGSGRRPFAPASHELPGHGPGVRFQTFPSRALHWYGMGFRRDSHRLGVVAYLISADSFSFLPQWPGMPGSPRSKAVRKQPGEVEGTHSEACRGLTRTGHRAGLRPPLPAPHSGVRVAVPARAPSAFLHRLK